MSNVYKCLGNANQQIIYLYQWLNRVESISEADARKRRIIITFLGWVLDLIKIHERSRVKGERWSPDIKGFFLRRSNDSVG